uniref:Uncharacterized protein n=1 Tax=Triticum urartu TaxID=4572 RepID=A0A8R7PDK3_TRIUA
MMEEPIEHHNSAEKDVESFDVHGRATNDEEGFTDCDDADENEDGKFVAHYLSFAIFDYSSS